MNHSICWNHATRCRSLFLLLRSVLLHQFRKFRQSEPIPLFGRSGRPENTARLYTNRSNEFAVPIDDFVIYECFRFELVRHDAALPLTTRIVDPIRDFVKRRFLGWYRAMNDKIYRAAIVGCGRIAGGLAGGDGSLGVLTHSEAYRASPRTALVGVCDADRLRAESFARDWGGGNAYTNINELLERERPEVVSLCTPDETHEELALAILQSSSRPLALFCEKPIALTVRGARRVVAAARDANVRLAVNYSRRYVDSVRAVRDLIQGGELGAVQTIHGWYTKGVMHNGSHWFDLLRYLVGEVVQASGRIARDSNPTDPDMDVTLEMASGTFAHLSSCDARFFAVFEMDLMFERGRIELREAALSPQLSLVKPSDRFPEYKELKNTAREFGDMRNPMLHAVEDIVHALDTSTEPLCRGGDGVAALAVAEAAILSARNGGKYTPVISYEA